MAAWRSRHCRRRRIAARTATRGRESARRPISLATPCSAMCGGTAVATDRRLQVGMDRLNGESGPGSRSTLKDLSGCCSAHCNLPSCWSLPLAAPRALRISAANGAPTSADPPFQVAPVATFDSPWALAFLPGSHMCTGDREAGPHVAGRRFQRPQAAGQRRPEGSSKQPGRPARRRPVADILERPPGLFHLRRAVGQWRQRARAGPRPTDPQRERRESCPVCRFSGTIRRAARAASSAGSWLSHPTASRCS